MHMSEGVRSGAVKLPTLAILMALVASIGVMPLDAQVAAGGVQPSRAKRVDSVFTLRVFQGTLERQLKSRLDSLRLVLDREPMSSGDREQLRAESERLVRTLSELSRMGAEISARLMTDDGSQVMTVIARGMAAGGHAEGLRRFQAAAPRGWIGIVAEAPNEYRIVGENQVIRYLDYPSIVSVDRNSPAARAGINAGDVLIAYDGSDIREREINLTRLLVPDRRLAVTVRRDGELKDYEMTVGRTNQAYIRRTFETTLAPMDTMIVRPVTKAGAVAQGRSIPNGTAIIASPVPMGAVFVARPGVSLVWGAQLSSINEGLGRSLGVGAGVLVLNVLSGTPAARSGLDDGDIIVKVNGKPVTSIETLWRFAAEREGEHAVDLDVLRAKKPVKVTLRWAR
jgi:membrane-associated protease RseP (regulator of RpoE activity)